MTFTDSGAQNNKNLKRFDGYVSREDRERLQGHKGAVIWFTGLSASGKSTIAHMVERKLFLRGCSTYVLDGDNVRHGLCSDLTFCPEDRAENIRSLRNTGESRTDYPISQGRRLRGSCASY